MNFLNPIPADWISPNFLFEKSSSPPHVLSSIKLTMVGPFFVELGLNFDFSGLIDVFLTI